MHLTTQYSVMSIFSVIFGLISLCSVIIYLLVYFFNHCFRKYFVKNNTNKYQIDQLQTNNDNNRNTESTDQENMEKNESNSGEQTNVKEPLGEKLFFLNVAELDNQLESFNYG